MTTHTTQTMSTKTKAQDSSKYQKMYDNLMNDHYPFQNLHEGVEQLKKEKMKQQTK